MKTSNKILLATFLTVILILVSVHIAIYAKYKKGDYVVVTDDMWPTNTITQSLTDVKYVSIDNVEDVTIQAADSSKLQYDKPGEGDPNMLSVTRRADTLFLLGKGNPGQDRWYKRTHLSLAGTIPVRIINSQLQIGTAKNIVQPMAIDITLDQSSLEIDNRQKKSLNFTDIKINAGNNSRINLFDVRTNRLDVTLKNSTMEEAGLSADSISVSTDMDSRLKLSGKNLIKAKIVSYE